MDAGDTFRFRANETHLWMVISDPALNKDRVLIVNMTTWRADKDQSCLLNSGDHPAVHHNSCISYADSRVHPDAHLNSPIASGQAFLDQKLSPVLLKRVRDGAARSKRMRLDHGQLLIDQGLVEA